MTIHSHEYEREYFRYQVDSVSILYALRSVLSVPASIPEPLQLLEPVHRFDEDWVPALPTVDGEQSCQLLVPRDHMLELIVVDVVTMIVYIIKFAKSSH